jgi:hypothetical protein
VWDWRGRALGGSLAWNRNAGRSKLPGRKVLSVRRAGTVNRGELQQLSRDRLADVKALLAACAADAELSDNWGIVKDWNEASRYERTARPKALALYAAVTNSKHGVLPWMRSRW